MLHRHLSTIKCPICKSNDRWDLTGSSNEHHITDGVISCNNNHKWCVKQEILRLDKENSDEAIIYSERELTGYPKEVSELERSEFLDFIEQYFKNIKFAKETVVVIGNSILFYRFLSNLETNFVTVMNDEKLLRQLHEITVQKRLHNNHSFIRANTIDASSANLLYLFQNTNDINLNPGDVLIQFNSNQNEPQGTILWMGQKYFLEEIINSN